VRSSNAPVVACLSILRTAVQYAPIVIMETIEAEREAAARGARYWRSAEVTASMAATGASLPPPRRATRARARMRRGSGEIWVSVTAAVQHVASV
jgi:hypothetical protein